MTAMLASVTCLDEAMLALAHGADIIDLKDPSQGALGALPLQTLREIATAVGGRRPVSATVGDLPMTPERVFERVSETAATGVDIVKVGFMRHPEAAACITALSPLCRQGVRVVGVLFADETPDFDALPLMAACGFFGAMLDTVSKDACGLLGSLTLTELQSFVTLANRLRLRCGLAGSLREGDIHPLAALNPDYLGFRGALCLSCDRTAPIQSGQMQRIRGLLQKYNNSACRGVE